MNIRESLNRGFNLLATTIIGLSGFAFLPEVFVEKDIPDKIDDSLLFIIGIVGIWWYNRSTNRLTRSVMPVALVVIALIVKVGGLLIEIGDPESFGDDIGGVILLVLSVGFLLYQYSKTKKLTDAAPM